MTYQEHRQIFYRIGFFGSPVLFAVCYIAASFFYPLAVVPDIVLQIGVFGWLAFFLQLEFVLHRLPIKEQPISHVSFAFTGLYVLVAIAVITLLRVLIGGADAWLVDSSILFAIFPWVVVVVAWVELRTRPSPQAE